MHTLGLAPARAGRVLLRRLSCRLFGSADGADVADAPGLPAPCLGVGPWLEAGSSASSSWGSTVLDHGLTASLLSEGKLPHLAALQKQGCFKALGSTLPPISPVAWSSFQTGVNPGKHNIFDFLTPDLRTDQPKLSSVEIRPARRSIRLGKYEVPLGKAGLRLLRKSKPFWNILSDHGIFNCICACRSRFRPRNCGASSSRPCVFPIFAAHRVCSLTTQRVPGN